MNQEEKRAMLKRQRHPPGTTFLPSHNRPASGDGPTWMELSALIRGGTVFPPEWEHWEMRNPDGWTLAFVAASHDRLPDGFTLWDMMQPNGEVVAHVAAARGTLPEDVHPSVWRLGAQAGRSVWDAAVEKNKAPAGGLPPWPDREMPALDNGSFDRDMRLF